MPAQLTASALEELKWWQQHLTRWNGRGPIAQSLDLTIETDASTVGWGALCQGTRTGGPWSPTERMRHINFLELLAATLAVKCFAKGKQNITIHLKVDNTTAMAYINKFGGTVSPELNQLTKELWLWCLERNISLQATHLAGILNCTADEESRVMKDRTDWMLCPRVFSRICQLTGPLQVDLFASRLTNQLSSYASWRPDPEAVATDTFSLDWIQFQGHPNPPWNLVGKVLSHVRNQRADVVRVSSTGVEITSMVPHATGNVGSTTTPLTRQTKPNPADSQSQQARHNPHTSRMGYLRDRFQSQKLSEGATTLLLASWREKTAKSL